MAHVRDRAHNRLHRLHCIAGGDGEFRKQTIRLWLGLLALVAEVFERAGDRLSGILRTLVLAEKNKIELVIGHVVPSSASRPRRLRPAYRSAALRSRAGGHCAARWASS